MGKLLRDLSSSLYETNPCSYNHKAPKISQNKLEVPSLLVQTYIISPPQGHPVTLIGLLLCKPLHAYVFILTSSGTTIYAALSFEVVLDLKDDSHSLALRLLSS